MSQTWVPFPDKADTALRKGAREIGEAILGRSGATIAKSTGGSLSSMPDWMRAAHERAALGANGRDIARVAAVRDPTGFFGKSAELIEDAARAERMAPSPFRDALEKSLERRTDELAAHEDRPSRENALSAAQHRELAQQHEVRQYAEFSAGNMEGARAHEAASNAHHRAAALASEHDSEAPFASHRAREATRRANRCCHEQVHLPGHAHKAAGDGFSAPAGRVRSQADSDAFRSQPVGGREFREPRGNSRAFETSGRVDAPGSDARSGYRYPADAPASPMERLFGPAVNASQMNWDSGSDFGPHRATHSEFGDLNWHRDDGIADRSRRAMTEGRVPNYDSSRPYPGYAGSQGSRTAEEALSGKAAGIAPGESLTAFSKRLMNGGSAPIAKSLDLAHELTVKGSLREGAYRSILKFRDWKRRSSDTTWQALKRDESAEYAATIGAIRSALISQSDRETLLASIA
jgi:hypothetical protein